MCRHVREIFALFQQHHSLLAVVGELARRRWKTKSRTSQNGRAHVGRSFTKASLRLLLTNAIYSGQVEHRGAMYVGEHAAIVAPSVWQEVNAELRAGRRSGTEVNREPQNALLAGLLICKTCQCPMVPTYTAKPDRRYRYYVCQTARKKGWSECPTKSVPARMIEDSVVDQLRTALCASETRERLNVLEADWQAFEPGHAELVRSLVREVSYDGVTGAVSLHLKRQREACQRKIDFTVPFRRVPTRRNQSTEPPPEPQGRSPRIARLLALTHKLDAMVRWGTITNYGGLARLGHISPARLSQIMVLLHLAPSIQEYVLFLSAGDDRIITELALRKIAREPRWDRQRDMWERLLKANDDFRLVAIESTLRL